MAAFNWGDLQLGRIPLRETFVATEAGGGDRTLALAGQESYPPLTRAQVVARHDGINSLNAGDLLAVTFTDKPERNGYYTIKTAASTYTEYLNDTVTADWTVTLGRLGSDSETDLQSRLTGAIRLNDFVLTGERWHAPPIGHYGYYTGATNPTTMTRTGADGTITIYRTIPTGVSPRWGCPPTSYLAGRVRLTTTGGQEVYGTDVPLTATGWALTNGLVNITPTASAGVIDVQSYTAGAWHSKPWNITIGGTNAATWNAATILRNDPEQCILRLIAARSPGRVTLDLTLRRGSRTVEGYLQSGSAATLAVYLATAETVTSFAGAGYVTATNDDADGNHFVAGSARTFTSHANGGVSKAAATALDFWLGVVASQSTLNANPTFETNTADWVPNAATLTRSNVQAKYGTWSGLLTSTAAANPRAESGLVAVTAGASYRASGWLFPPAALPTGAGVNVNWFDAAQAYITTSANSTVPTAGVWQFYDQVFAAPAGAAFATVVFSIGGTPGAALLLYGDDVRIRAATASGDAATDLRNQYIACMPEAVYGTRR